MLSDEWKMRMGNECEVSVCWLESALPKKLDKSEGVKEEVEAKEKRNWRKERKH